MREIFVFRSVKVFPGIFFAVNLFAATIHIPADYASIQMGIDSAAPYDTISIAADTFHECIEIYKPLTIMGVDTDQTVITPPDSQTPQDSSGWWPSYTFNIFIKADSVTITKLTQCGGYYCGIPGGWSEYLSRVGIRIDSSRYIDIKNCIICGNAEMEVAKQENKGGSSDTISGILFNNSSNISIENNVIAYNKEYGITGYNTYQVKIENNACCYSTGMYWDQYVSGLAFGISLSKCDSIIINNNVISRIDGWDAPAYGIYVDSSEFITLERNKIDYVNGNSNGIAVCECNDLIIKNNIISNITALIELMETYFNNTKGIYINTSDDVSVMGNMIYNINGGRTSFYGSASYGIEINNSSVKISQNTIVGAKAGWEYWNNNIHNLTFSGIGIGCRKSSCIIERNAVIDNEIGIYIDTTNVEVKDCNIYFNPYHRYPNVDTTANYSLYTKYPNTVENNFWWYKDSTIIDSIISGSADFMPFAVSPIDSAPGEPSAVSYVKVFSDTAYSVDFNKYGNYNDYLYIELQGTDWNNHFYDPAVVIIKTKEAPLGIAVGLIETDTASGIYRGTAMLTDTLTNDEWNYIAIGLGDTIIISANVDSIKCDTVIAWGPGIEENSKVKTQNAKLEISQNPFIKSTILRYQIPMETTVSLKIYDLSGKLVKTLVNEQKQPGGHSVNFDVKGLPSGVYFARFSANNLVVTRKIILVK